MTEPSPIRLHFLELPLPSNSVWCLVAMPWKQDPEWDIQDIHCIYTNRCKYGYNLKFQKETEVSVRWWGRIIYRQQDTWVMKGDRKLIFFLIKKRKWPCIILCSYWMFVHSFEEGIFKSTLTRLSVPIQFSILCEFWTLIRCDSQVLPPALWIGELLLSVSYLIYPRHVSELFGWTEYCFQAP